MKVTIAPIVIGAFDRVTKGLLKGLEEWRPSKQQHYWRRPEYWEESCWLEETCCHSNSSEKPLAYAERKNCKRVYNHQQKKRTCRFVNFAVPADHTIKLKECKKKDKYLDLSRELKKLWNMKVTIIPIVIGAFGTVTKGVLKGVEDLEFGGWVKTIQTLALLRTARLVRRVQETWGDLLSLKL